MSHEYVEVLFPEDFDEILGVFYGKAIHPKDLHEVACNLAALVMHEDISTAEMEQVLCDNGVVDLTPATARRYVAEAVQKRRAS